MSEEMERLRADVDSMQQDVRDAQDFGDLSRCRKCKRLAVRRGWCCAACGDDSTDGTP
jgi:ribosomal protein L37AE/L43A